MDIYPGALVVSTAGRDKDSYFAVLSVADGFAYLTDGKIRKVNMPKKKKLKHLRVTGLFLEQIAERLKEEQTVTNAMVRKAISERV